ncbi:MAG: signal peptidase II [Bacillota bacterium]|nr:signal peptidase II [Bacillota bacterium]
MVWIIVVAGIVLDQLTKRLAAATLADGRQIELIPHFLYLTYGENRGAAWSLFAGQDWGIYLLSLISVLAAILFAVWLRRETARPRRVALALILSGTIGNLIDRVAHGYVVDFIDTHFGSYRFPTFNIADSLLVTGMFVLVFILIRAEWKEHQGARHEPDHDHR